MPASNDRAVFLSYALDNQVVADRLADVFRAAGIEVWSSPADPSDHAAWNPRIRTEIGSCVLFIPVISSATQLHKVGGFHLEWQLAHERIKLIAEGSPFLLPVVLDDIPEREAQVPVSFRQVPWTRADVAATETFAQRVKGLLEWDRVVPSTNSVAVDSSNPAPDRLPRWLVFLLIGSAIALLAVIIGQKLRRSTNAVPPVLGWAAANSPAVGRSA